MPVVAGTLQIDFTANDSLYAAAAQRVQESLARLQTLGQTATDALASAFQKLAPAMSSVATSGAGPALQQVAEAAQRDAQAATAAAVSTRDLALQKTDLLGSLKTVNAELRSETTVLADAQKAAQQYGGSQKALADALQQSQQKVAALSAQQAQLQGSLNSVSAALKQTQTAAQGAAAGISQITPAAVGATTSTVSLRSAMQSLSQGMLLGGAALAGVGAGFALLLKQGSDLQQALVHVAGNTSMSAAEFENLQKAVLHLGATTPVAMDDIGRSYMQAANFGFHMADATTVVSAALKSAVATGASAEQTTRALAVAMHLFGIPTEDAAKAMDILHLAAARGGQTLEQFTAVTGRVFSVAHAMGVGLVDVAAAMSALTQTGLSAAQSATALQGAIFKIVNPSKSAREELERLHKLTGVDLPADFSKTGLTAKGLSGVMDDIHKAVGNNTDAITKFLPAQRGALAAIMLTTVAADDYKARLLELNDVIAGKLTPTQQDYDRAMQTVGAQIDLLKNKFEILGLELLTALGPSLVSGLETLNKFLLDTVGFIGQLPPSFAIATAAFLTTAGVVGTVSVALGGLIFLLGGPVALAVVTLGGVIGAFAAAVATNFGGITDAIRSWFGTSRVSFISVAGFIGAMLDSFLIFGRLAVGIFDVVGTSIRIFVGQVLAAYPAIKGLGEAIIGIATQDTAKIAEGLATLGVAVKQGLVDAIGQGAAFAGRELERLGANAENLNGKFARGFALAAMDAGKFGDNIAQVAGRVKAAWDKAAEGLDDLADHTGKAGKKAKDATEKLVAEQLALVNDWLKATGRDIDISAAAWKLVPEATKQAFEAQAAQFHKSVEEAQAWKAAQLAIALTTGEAFAPALHIALDALDGFVAAERDVAGVAEAANRVIGDTEPYVRAGLAAQELGGGLARLKAAVQNVKESIASSRFFDELKAQDEAARMFDGVVRIFEQQGQRLGETQDQINARVLTGMQKLGVSLPPAMRTIADQVVVEFKKGMDRLPGALDEIFNKLALGAKHQVSGIFDVINNLPGVFGDNLRKSTNVITTWINQIDGVLKGLHKIFASIPDGLAGAIQAVISVFKGTTSVVASTTAGIAAGAATAAAAAASAAAAVASEASSVAAAAAQITAAEQSIGTAAQAAATQVESAANRASTAWQNAKDQIKNSNQQTSSSFSQLATGIIGALAGIMTVANVFGSGMGRIKGGIQGALGGATAGASIGFLFGGPAGAGIGALIGAGVGAIAGILGGGQTELQKLQATAALQQAKDAVKLSMQQVLKGAQDVIQSGIDTFSKAIDFFGNLDEFTQVRKGKFQAFFSNLSRLMDYFIELAKKFSGESLAQMKAAADAIAPVADALSRLPLAFDAISNHMGVPKTKFDLFFRDFSRLMTRFFADTVDWIDGQSKQAQKVAERLAPVIGIFAPLIDAIKNMGNIEEPSNKAFHIVFVSLDRFVNRISDLADTFDKSVLKAIENFATKIQPALTIWKDATDAIRSMVGIPLVTDAEVDAVTTGIELFITKLGASIEKMGDKIDVTKIAAFAQTIVPIATALKTWADTSAAVRGYTAIASQSWDDIVTDFGKAIQLMGVLIGQATQFEAMAITLEAKLKSGAQHLTDGIKAMTDAVAATAAALQTNFGHIQGGVPPGTIVGGGSVGTTSFPGGASMGTQSLPANSGGGGAAGSSMTTNIHLGGIVVNGNDPKAHALVKALADLLGTNTGLDAALAQWS